MANVVCIPDASAIEHLHGIIIGGRDIRDWLIDELEVLPTVKMVDEYEEGCKRLGVKDSLINRLRKRAESVDLEDAIRQALKNLVAHSFSKFQDGELTGVRLGLRFLKVDELRTRHIVFLCDDLDAFESNQGKSLLETVPAFCFWTSADFILYLVFRFGSRGGVGMSKDDFSNALEIAIQRMCPALTMPPGTAMKEKARGDWMKRKQKYLNCFERAYEGSFISW